MTKVSLVFNVFKPLPQHDPAEKPVADLGFEIRSVMMSMTFHNFGVIILRQSQVSLIC